MQNLPQGCALNPVYIVLCPRYNAQTRTVLHCSMCISCIICNVQCIICNAQCIMCNAQGVMCCLGTLLLSPPDGQTKIDRHIFIFIYLHSSTISSASSSLEAVFIVLIITRPGGRSRILCIWAAAFHRQMAKPNWTTHTQNTIYIHT